MRRLVPALPGALFVVGLESARAALPAKPFTETGLSTTSIKIGGVKVCATDGMTEMSKCHVAKIAVK